MTEDILPSNWDGDRLHLCLEGVYELDKMARTLPFLVEKREDQEHYIVRALAGRMLRITGMLLSAMDEDIPTKDLEKRIYLESGQG